MQDSFTNSGLNQPGDIYQPESKITLRGTVKVLVYGNIVTFLFSFTCLALMLHHSYAIFDYLLIVITWFFFFITILNSATSGLMTNRFFIYLLTIMLGACFIYTKCILYIQLVSHAWPQNFEPLNLYNQVIILATAKPVTLYAMQIKGNELFITWGIESLLMTILTMLGTKFWLEDTFICHNCATELEEPNSSLTLEELPSEHSLDYWKNKFVTGNFSVLENLKPVAWHAENRTLIKLYNCDCGKLNIIKLSQDSYEATNSKQTEAPERISIEVLENLIISQSNYNKLKNLD